MSRVLSAGERRLAASVFGGALDLDRVRISVRRTDGPAVALGSHLSFPRSRPPPADIAGAPLEWRAWLVHELVHAWQFQTAPWRTLANWALTLLSGGYGPRRRAYRYALPLKPWRRLNLEQQAMLVEHAYVFRESGACEAAPSGLDLAAIAACLPAVLVAPWADQIKSRR